MSLDHAVRVFTNLQSEQQRVMITLTGIEAQEAIKKKMEEDETATLANKLQQEEEVVFYVRLFSGN